MRASVASAGNDHRLGANEAPPAIVSIFLGDQLAAVVDDADQRQAVHEPCHARRSWTWASRQLAAQVDAGQHGPQPHLPVRLHRQQVRVPCVRLPSRTFPTPNLVLNTAVAEKLDQVRHRHGSMVRPRPTSSRRLALGYCKKTLTDHQRILFSGDGYSDEWPVEAEKRGLAQHASTTAGRPAVHR